MLLASRWLGVWWALGRLSKLVRVACGGSLPCRWLYDNQLTALPSELGSLTALTYL